MVKLSVKDWTFRRRFIRAMNIQRRAGKLSKEEYGRIKRACFSHMNLARFGTEGVFIAHLRQEVEARMSEEHANGLLDIFDNLTFDGVVQWLLDNWQVILQVVLALLVFLKEESEK